VCADPSWSPVARSCARVQPCSVSASRRVITLPPTFAQLIGLPPDANVIGGQYVMPCERVDNLPQITFTINGKEFSLDGSEYVLKLEALGQVHRSRGFLPAVPLPAVAPLPSIQRRASETVGGQPAAVIPATPLVTVARGTRHAFSTPATPQRTTCNRRRLQPLQPSYGCNSPL
jgi:hypothetical protein